MDGGAWWAAVHGVAKSRIQGTDFTFHFHALEKEMATHSSVLAWRIPGTGEPGGLPSMGSQNQTRPKRLSSKAYPYWKGFPAPHPPLFFLTGSENLLWSTQFKFMPWYCCISHYHHRIFHGCFPQQFRATILLGGKNRFGLQTLSRQIRQLSESFLSS